MENGPRAILTSRFLSDYRYQVDQYRFSNPDLLHDQDFYPTLAKEIQDLRLLINQSIKPHQTQVVLGGDHSVTLPSVLACLDRKRDDQKLLYIQFDSHGDCNLLAKSPTANFHGMYLRPLFGNDFDIPEIKNIVDHRLRSPNIIYFGNLDLDGDEPQFFQTQKITNYTPQDIDLRLPLIQKRLSLLINSVSHIHISFDIDCLDRSLAPSTGIPAMHGLTLQQITPILKQLSLFPSLSIDLVEFNPTLPGREITQKTIHQVLNLLLQP